MSYKQALVFGAQGMFGKTLCAYLAEQNVQVQKCDLDQMDLRSPNYTQLRQWIQKADFVVNAAALLHPQVSSLPCADVIAVNSVFPKNLGRICAQEKVPAFLISTDGVFDLQAGTCYEDDLPNATDLYGMSKIAGESSEVMTIRTSIIGENPGNSGSLLEWARSQAGQSVKGFTNQKWNGVTTLHLSQVILEVVKQGLYQPGLRHLCSPQSLSKYDLLNLISEVYDLRLAISPLEAPQKVERLLASRSSLPFSEKSIAIQVSELKKFFNGKTRE